jgi:hypothetical protein
MQRIQSIPLLVCALAMIAALAGCHATVEAKWATTDDTVYRWEKAAPNLPIEVRGQLPGATHAQIVQALPHALPVNTADDMASGAARNTQSERWVVELGDAVKPDNTYCSQPARSAPGSAAAPLALTVALCDGHRLVATSQSPLDANKASVGDLPRKINRLKNLTLIGIARSPAQYVEVQS